MDKADGEVLPPDLQDVTDGSATLTDRLALLQATAVLFPRRAREILRANGSLSNSEIAKVVDLPERNVALVMSESWDPIHAILVKMTQRSHAMAQSEKTQAEKFAELARELGCDEDEDAFDERLKKLATAPKKDQPSSDEK